MALLVLGLSVAERTAQRRGARGSAARAPYAIAALFGGDRGRDALHGCRAVAGPRPVLVLRGPAGPRRARAPTCCPTASSSAGSLRPAIASSRRSVATRGPAARDREVERAQTHAADARVAAAGDAGVHRAAVPVRHAASKSNGYMQSDVHRAAIASIDELIVYLRAALPQLRESTSTMAKEARARARVAQHPDACGTAGGLGAHRGRRPPTQRRCGSPPMILLPLVDHAVAAATRCRAASAFDSTCVGECRRGHDCASRLRCSEATQRETERGPLAGVRERLEPDSPTRRSANARHVTPRGRVDHRPRRPA